MAEQEFKRHVGQETSDEKKTLGLKLDVFRLSLSPLIDSTRVAYQACRKIPRDTTTNRKIKSTLTDIIVEM